MGRGARAEKANDTRAGTSGASADLSQHSFRLRVFSGATGNDIDPLSAINEFGERVRRTWVPKLAEPQEGFDAQTAWHQLERSGQVSIVELHPRQLHAMNDQEKILWKEPFLWREDLRLVPMPLDPKHSFQGEREGPPILVRSPEHDVYVVVNGNHRLGACMKDEFNPDSHPIWVVVFNSREAYEALSQYELKISGFVSPVEKPGHRPR